MSKEEFIFNVNTLAGCKYGILRDLKKESRVEKQYHRKFLMTQMASLITTGLSYVDQWRYHSLSKDLEIEKPPIYVLGHWRSGTTLLHNLLCSFQGTSYPTTYQTVFPNNLFFLQGFLKEIMKFHLPKKRLVDRIPMHVNFPQEEDFALGNEAGFSYYYWFYFPKDYQKFTQKYLSLSSDDRSRTEFFKEGYTRFIKRCLLNMGGDQYVAKNPPNMARIPFLLDLFPGSRFIYTERNPYEVLMSTFKFFKGFLKTLQLQDMDDNSLWDFIFSNYKTLFNAYLESKTLIPSSHLVELKYEDIVADPELTLNSLRRDFLSDLSADEVELKRLLEVAKKHKANTYTFEQSYIDRVNSELGDLIEKQGYKLL